MLFNRLGDLFYLSGANGYESEKPVEHDSTMILNSLLVHISHLGSDSASCQAPGKHSRK